MKVQISENDIKTLTHRVLREMLEGQNVVPTPQEEAIPGLDDLCRQKAVVLENWLEYINEKIEKLNQLPNVVNEIYQEINQTLGQCQIQPGKYDGWYTIAFSSPIQYDEANDCWHSQSGQVEDLDLWLDEIIPEEYSRFIDIYTDEGKTILPPSPV